MRRARMILAPMALLAMMFPVVPALAQGSAAQPAEVDAQAPRMSMAEAFEEAARNTGLRQMIAKLVDQMLVPGESKPDFATSGVDVVALVEARPGGLAGNVLVDRDEVPTISSYDGRPVALGAGYEVHEIFSRGLKGDIETSLFKLAPGIWLEAASTRTARDKAICYSGIGRMAVHSRRPLKQWTEQETGMVLTLVETLKLVAHEKICSTYRQEKGGTLLTSAFLPDGRSLPKLDEQATRFEIMSRAEAMALYLKE